jgi:hypothetical protein
MEGQSFKRTQCVRGQKSSTSCQEGRHLRKEVLGRMFGQG